MVERRDVEFGVDGGDRLRGCLFLPSKRAGPPPISVAHGYAGVKEHGLELLVLGATDRRIRAVVSQVPTISGYEQGLRREPPDAFAAREHHFDEDERAQLRGEPPRLQQVVNAEIESPPGPDPRPERSQQL
jgi:cephalosporin-C deacetylase-like acetyl esterase